MKHIEVLVERYHDQNSSIAAQIIKALGVLSFYLGLIILLWSLPNEIILNWLGNNEFSHWATVYAVLLIIYFGSESFSLTFGGGGFMIVMLFAARYLLKLDIDFFQELFFILIGGGFALLLVSRLLSGTISKFYKDIIYIPIMPVWILRYLYNWLNVPF